MSMRAVLFLLAGIAAAVGAVADGRSATTPATPAVHQVTLPPSLPRNRLPVNAVTTVAPGQAGYVHFFVITDSRGETETQLGIELDDQRIAWSVPGIGVNVSPFIADGTIGAEDRPFAVRHLYGFRPFPDDETMRLLRKDMLARIVPLIEADTPYCYLRPLSGEFCLNCLGFVMRVIFPGPTAQSPVLPPDFARKGAGAFYTTEDMLLYLAGLHGLPSQAARLQRIAQLSIPQHLRDDLVELVNGTDFDTMSAMAEQDPDKSSVARTLVKRPRTPGSVPKSRQNAYPAKRL